MSPSIWQILIVVAIIVVLFGANRLPGLGKSLGQAIRGFKKGISEDEIDVTDSSKSEQLKQSDSQNQKETEKEKTEQS
ncbi:MAG: twin-arginine translocase TatA/TatE family subunit [Bdellovibrionales bacterium]|nr:twin-arginine translocase TatA/TatE family subunit [Bdellovibrionales bacterium]